jgi:hypothetical protein
MSIDMDFMESVGVEVNWGFQLTLELRDDPQNVVIPIGECELEGFTYDIFTEYKQPSVRRTAKRGRIIAIVPISGTYYPAILLYDGRGKEVFRLSIDGEEKGIIVADRDDNRTYVFTLKEPITFQGGEEITLETLTSEGTYRVEDILLLKEKPAPRKRTYEINHVGTRLRDDGSVAITFITSWDVPAKVEYGLTPDYGRSISEGEPLNNHRIVLRNLEPNAVYHYRIVALTDEGETVTTQDLTFSTAPRKLPRGRASLKRIHLTTTHGLSDSRFVPPGVTSGIPFPQGDVSDPNHIRLLCGGKEIPLQVKVLSRYPDRSIRWVLLDFQLQGNEKEYTLEYGREVRRMVYEPENPVRIIEDEDKIRVDTGPLRMIIDKRHGTIFDEIWMNGKLVTSKDKPCGLMLIHSDGRAFGTSEPPDEIRVLESGPLHSALLVRGRHRSDDGEALFTYEFELHFYAGWPGIKLFHIWGNDNISGEFTSIRSLSLRIPVLADKSLTFGGDTGDSFEISDSTGRLSLEQYYDDEFQILKDEMPLFRGKRASGWVALGDVAVLVRNFWQLYPKTLSVDRDGIEIGIMPPLNPDQYLNREEPEYRLYYYLKDGLYRFRRGVTKRHEIWILPSTLIGKLSQGKFEGQPLALAPPRWYAESGAMGRFVPSAEHAKLPEESVSFVKTYDTAVERGFEGYLKNREKNREYGMLNFGDWWGERRINWGNIEYDTQHALFLQFLRSGDFRYFLVGEETERHNMDVDTVWYGPERGLVYAHCIGHTGGYYPKSPVEGQGSPRGGFSVSHTWVEGHLDYYLLTGDRRAWEAARMIAGRYNSYNTRNYDFTNCRIPGWHLILAMAMYHATGDPFHLNAARIIVERVLERQTPDGGWRRQMMPGHCRCLPRHRGNAGFMVGVLMSGLKYYHEVTKDPRVAKSIVKAAHFVIDDMWVPEVHGFRYTSCPNSPPSPGLNSLIIEGIAYANTLKPDPKLEGNLRDQIEHFQEVSGFGKSFSQHTRSMPKTLADILCGVNLR